MPDDPSHDDFPAMIARVRSGDSDAATDLVNRYGEAVRVAVRVRLRDPKLRRQFDSMDVCQSVMASFFLRAAAGQFDLDDPKQLVGLLVKMAQNKLFMQIRKHQQQCRDVRQGGVDIADAPVADGAPSPEREAIGKEMLAKFLARLSPEERILVDARMMGRAWGEIAEQVGASPEACRMKVSRAADRIGSELGLEDSFFDEDTK